ncbi:MAG: endonuclease domain-containing protein, partial [Longimicrobiales bacterium]
GRRELERAFAQAERRNRIDRAKLRSLAARHGSRRGTPLLCGLIEDETGPAWTRSEAEERFLALIRKAELPTPEVNVSIGKCEVDFFWRHERLVVEVDGFAFHSSQRKFESDRRRDARLSASGVRVVRVTWRQVVDEPEAMLVRVAQTLALEGMRSGPRI